MTKPPMEELVEAAQCGDIDALDELLRLHMPGLLAFVRSQRNPNLARESTMDLVQTACRQALQRLGEFEWRGDGSFRNWLFALAMNKIRDRRKYHQSPKRDPAREQPIADDESRLLVDVYASIATPSQNAAAGELAARVEAALRQLPDAQRDVVVLRRFVGLDYSQIAEYLDKSEVAVRALMSRALVRLSSLLGE